MDIISLKKVHIINFLVSILMSISIVYGFMEFETTFIFTNLIALIYSSISVIILTIVSIAGIREMHPPEILDCFEIHYSQLVLVFFTNLLCMGTSFTGLVIGSILLFYSITTTLYIRCYVEKSKNTDVSTTDNAFRSTSTATSV